MINILMVDDHPSQIEAYKMILSYNTLGHTITTTVAHNCKDAYTIVSSGNVSFDMVFLDLSLPPYLDKNLNGGEDLAKIVRLNLPETKIVILTSHAESFTLYNLVKKIDPAGILVKSDFSGEELLNAYGELIAGETYYSETVKRSIADLLATENYLDAVNRQIITLISKGIKTKSLPEYLHLSQSAIEKRKVAIKEYFDIDKGTDEDILREAKKRGFV